MKTVVNTSKALKNIYKPPFLTKNGDRHFLSNIHKIGIILLVEEMNII